MGMLNLSYNDLDWKELRHLFHMTILCLTLTGNGKLDSDPNCELCLLVLFVYVYLFICLFIFTCLFLFICLFACCLLFISMVGCSIYWKWSGPFILCCFTYCQQTVSILLICCPLYGCWMEDWYQVSSTVPILKWVVCVTLIEKI